VILKIQEEERGLVLYLQFLSQSLKNCVMRTAVPATDVILAPPRYLLAFISDPSTTGGLGTANKVYADKM
jgi:hypothetical protein